jgi:cytochrome P450
MLVSTDPPRHTQLRRPLNGRLTAREVDACEDDIRRAVAHVLRPVLDGAGVDVTWDVAERAGHLPMAVAGALLGLPEADWADLSRWTAMAAAPEDPGLRVRTGAATLAIAHHAIFEYFAGQVRQRRTDPGRTDLIAHLTTMSVGQDRLTDEEAIYNCYSLLLGANATTPHAASGTLLALLEHPDQLAVAGDSLPELVEEGLRWTSPANSFLRHAVRDTELSGGVVRAGEAVAVWVGSANRDDAVFTDPYRFHAGRSDNRHIAFGFGPHYCIGAPLARLTLRVFLAEFLRLIDTVEPAGPVSHLASHFVAGITRLPVRTRLRTGVSA